MFCILSCVAHHSSQNRIVFETYDRTISNHEAVHELNKTEREHGELIELIAFVRHYLYVPIHAMHFSAYIFVRLPRIIKPARISEVDFFIPLKKSLNAI